MIRMSHDEMRTVFTDWNKTELEGFLLANTADALGVRDIDGEPLLEKVLDVSARSETPHWTIDAALAIGAPFGILAGAVLAGDLSVLREERISASAVLGGPKAAPTGERQSMIEDFRKALLASTLLALSEGFVLLGRASKSRHWDLSLPKIANIWAECGNLRSSLMSRMAEAYRKEPELESALVSATLKPLLDIAMPALRKVVARSMESGIPVPAMSAALTFYDGFRSTRLPANLIQALRDRSTASGYERVDRPRGEIFHSDWS